MAIDFVRKHGNERDQYALNIFLANKHLDDEEKWLLLINKYLAKFKLLPIALLDNNSSRFQRLTCKADYSIFDGPLVSIIMTTYNTEGYVEQSINSLLLQTWSNLEIIVVDDASTDNTLSIINSIAERDKRIKVISNHENVGPFVSKNRAILMVKGKYVTCHDSDDWAHPQRIENHVKVMIENKNIKASISSMLRLSLNGEFTQFLKLGGTSFDGVMRLASVSCMFDVFAFKEQLGFWDDVRFSADSELIERARKVFGEGYVVVKQIGMLCLDREDSLTNHEVNGVSNLEGLSNIRKELKLIVGLALQVICLLKQVLLRK